MLLLGPQVAALAQLVFSSEFVKQYSHVKNYLFYKNLLCLLSDIIYLIEDETFFTKYPFHKQKLILHRASMKSYYDYLISIFYYSYFFLIKLVFYI